LYIYFYCRYSYALRGSSSKKTFEIKNLKLKGGAMVWLRYSLFYIFISSFHFFIHYISIFIVGIHMPFGEAHPKKHLKLKGGAMVWLR
ncbi:hypothetical protein OBK08_11830, partial [Empedobacter falsenii]